MRATMLVGGANTRLSDSQLSVVLRDRGITYVPDFVAMPAA